MRTVVSWSGGKDSALALAECLDAPDVDVVELLTTVGEETGRSSMHGVRRDRYVRQAAAIGRPIRFVEIPDDASNAAYEERMATVAAEHAARGVDTVTFADLYLEDIRAYREERLAGTGIRGNWPLWKRDTETMARAFIDAGFRATVVCVDGDRLGRDCLGRAFDASFLDALPDTVDPCGENGEFHTFVHDGPIFDAPVPVELGDTVTREPGDGVYHYVDLLAPDA